MKSTCFLYSENSFSCSHDDVVSWATKIGFFIYFSGAKGYPQTPTHININGNRTIAFGLGDEHSVTYLMCRDRVSLVSKGYITRQNK